MRTFPYPRVLVTGGAGFIGSHLCERLLAEGCEVLSVDSYVTGSEAHLAHLADHPRFEARRHDVTEPLPVDLSVDAIVNLACPASPVHYQRDPVHTTLSNVLGTTHLLRLAQRLGAPILQASTSEVYGDPEVHPQPETYPGAVNPIGPRSCYDEGKRCAETLCFDFHRQHGVPIRVARIFNTYGPRLYLDDGRVVSNFIVQALRGEDLTLFGDGSQTRSFGYIDDLIEALVRMLRLDMPCVGPLNLGSDHEVSMRTLAETIVRLTGSRSRITQHPLPEDDPRRRRPDLTQARALLDWAPTTSLEQGLRQTIAYFRGLLRARGEVD